MADEFVLQTIKKLLGAGVEEETIISTLRDIGLSTEEAKRAIKQASIREEKEEAVLERPKMPRPETLPKLESGVPKPGDLDLVLSSLKTLSKKIDSIYSQTLPSDLEKSFREIKAKLSSLENLMQKLLEINRKILKKI